MYFLVSFDIVFNAFNLQCLGAPYCLNKKNFMSNLGPLVFPTCLFNTPLIVYCHIVMPCQYSHLFVVAHLLVLSRCVFVVDQA
jgi:hypothetical protein